MQAFNWVLWKFPLETLKNEALALYTPPVLCYCYENEMKQSWTLLVFAPVGTLRVNVKTILKGFYQPYKVRPSIGASLRKIHAAHYLLGISVFNFQINLKRISFIFF